MQFSNLLSDAVLAATGVYVFLRFCTARPHFEKLLWGIFLITLSVTALAGVVRFAGVAGIVAMHLSLQLLVGSLGVLALVVAVWCNISGHAATARTFYTTVAAGFVIFGFFAQTQYGSFAVVLQSLAMLVVMLLAVWGLLQKQKTAVWFVLAVMVAGIATKVGSFGLPINPTDAYHYALALSLFAFGKGAAGPKTQP